MRSRNVCGRWATRPIAGSLVEHADNGVAAADLAHALLLLVARAVLRRRLQLEELRRPLRRRALHGLHHGLGLRLPLADDLAAVVRGRLLARVEDEVRILHEARRQGLRARLGARRAGHTRHRGEACLAVVLARVLLHHVHAAGVLALVRVVLERRRAGGIRSALGAERRAAHARRLHAGLHQASLAELVLPVETEEAGLSSNEEQREHQWGCSLGTAPTSLALSLE